MRFKFCEILYYITIQIIGCQIKGILAIFLLNVGISLPILDYVILPYWAHTTFARNIYISFLFIKLKAFVALPERFNKSFIMSGVRSCC